MKRMMFLVFVVLAFGLGSCKKDKCYQCTDINYQVIVTSACGKSKEEARKDAERQIGSTMTADYFNEHCKEK